MDTTIRLHNSKTRKKEVFEPLNRDNVRMYLCGPTVYDRAHLGNGRPVVVFDVLFRLLRHVYGAEHVTYVRNFTDVDDKINATAQARKAAGDPRSLEALIKERTEETIGWYHADMDALGALRPMIKGEVTPKAEPRATDYIPQMIEMIQTLIDGGHAYEKAGHVLFRVRSYKEYGALSGRSIDDMIAGARVEVAPFKEDPMDFVLWKPSDADLPGWESPWGRGRPGWHIECSAMSHELLGASFDIHAGGLDLQFPHHENEVAQSCCAHPEAEFARVWMHNEMLQVEGKKMSKSLGNFFTVRDLLEQGVPGEVIRFVYLMTHYRKSMDWTDTKRQQAEKTLQNIAAFLASPAGAMPWFDWRDAKVPEEVVEALANDLNTSLALSYLDQYLKEMNEVKLVCTLRILGFEPYSLREKFAAFEFRAGKQGRGWGHSIRTFGNEAGEYHDQLQKLGIAFEALRKRAMESKDFTAVDRMKTALLAVGVEVRMSKEGVQLLPGPNFDPAKLPDLP